MRDPVVKNAIDEGQIKNARIKEKLGRETELNDLKFILNTDQGKRFIWRYLGICGVYTSSFTGNSETFFKEGKRVIGTTLLKEVIEADPDSYLKMIKQNNGEIE